MGVDEGNIQVMDGRRNYTVMENWAKLFLRYIIICTPVAPVVQVVTSKPSDVGT